MKKTVLLLSVICVFLISCKEDKKNENVAIPSETAQAFPELTFEETEHDFGQMSQGEERSTVFRFKNTGSGILQISSIKAKCGCTVPNDWPAGPILPGDSGEFTVKFNSRSKKGNIRQPITITSNTNTVQDVVTIIANVKVTE